MTRRTNTDATIAALVAMTLWFATLAAQNVAPPSARRTVASEAAAPGIDRGLRGDDPPPARTASDIIVRASSDRAPYLRGSVIVKFRQGTTPAAQQAILAAIDGRATADLSYADFDVVSLRADADPEATARRLAAQPDVAYAQARYLVRPAFRPNDPLYGQQWNYPAIDMERAWDINPGATPTVVVAILDTGVAYRSLTLRFETFPTLIETAPETPELFPSLGAIEVPFAAAPELGGPDRFVAPRDFIWDDTTPVDMDGHGTHVAGIVGQLTNNNIGVAGMAFNVRLMPVKVIDGFWDAYFGSPFIGTDDVVARGVRYAVDNGAQVLNMSIGRTGDPAPVVQEAIAYAVSRGAFVAVAGGNDFLEANPRERIAEFAPQIDGMVAVSAVGRDRARATYSSVGPHVELTAPGGDASRGGAASTILQQTYDLDFVETFVDGPAGLRPPRFDIFAYERFQGTSMAVPHVSGLAAMLIQQGITNPAAIEAAMKRYATDLGPRGRDDEYGFGLINPRASLRGMGLAR